MKRAKSKHRPFPTWLGQTATDGLGTQFALGFFVRATRPRKSEELPSRFRLLDLHKKTAACFHKPPWFARRVLAEAKLED